MTVRDLAQSIETIAPLATAETWDNVGLQVGDPDSVVDACLLALDVTPETIGEAKRVGAALVVAHHPVIFGGLTALTPAVPSGRAILAAARTGVAIYVAHTNLDASMEFGTCPALADRLGFPRGTAMLPWSGKCYQAVLTGDEARIQGLLTGAPIDQSGLVAWNVMGDEGRGMVRGELPLTASDGLWLAEAGERRGVRVDLIPVDGRPDASGTGMVCAIPQITLGGLAEYVVRRLGLRDVQVCGEREQSLQRVALVPGSGGGLVEQAARTADALITGEIKYHDALRARELGLGVIAAGHYDTERPVLALLAEYLAGQCGDELRVAISQFRTEPIWAWREG